MCLYDFQCILLRLCTIRTIYVYLNALYLVKTCVFRWIIGFITLHLQYNKIICSCIQQESIITINLYLLNLDAHQ